MPLAYMPLETYNPSRAYTARAAMVKSRRIESAEAPPAEAPPDEPQPAEKPSAEAPFAADPTKPSWLYNIPVELLLHIISYLSPEDRILLAETSRDMRSAVHQIQPTTIKIPLSYVIDNPVLFEWARDRHYPTDPLMQHITRFNKVDQLMAWREADVPWTTNSLSNIAQHGNLEIVKWAHGDGAPMHPTTLDQAIKSGWLGLVQWAFHTNGHLVGWDTFFKKAVKSDHTHIVRWAMGLTGRESNCVDTRPEMCALAAANGNLDMLMCLRGFNPDGTRFTEHVCSWDKQTTANAAEAGHLTMLKWTRGYNRDGTRSTEVCPWDDSVTTAAARINRLTMLKWARGYNRDGSETDDPCPWNERTCEYAAKNGNLDMLVWARTHGCPWDATATKAAATKGHLHILRYLRGHTDGGVVIGTCHWNGMCLFNATKYTNLCIWAHVHGCPWNGPRMSALAASDGNLDLVKYNHKKELGWDANTCAAAAKHGHLDILQWAHENECVWNAHTTSNAALQGHLEILEYAHSRGCPISPTIVCGNLATMQYIHRQNIPWHNNSLLEVIKKKNVDAVKWALEHGCMWPDSAPDAIAFTEDITMLRCALEHHCPNMGTIDFNVNHSYLTNLIKELHQHNVPWNDHTCFRLAARGRLDLIQYARRRGCQWDVNVLNMAITCGRLDIVQWVMWWPGRRERPEGYIVPDESTLDCVTVCTHVDVLDWCYDHGLQWTDRSQSYKNLSVMLWATAKGIYILRNTLERAVNGGHVHVAELLLMHNMIMKNAPEWAARNNDLEMLKRVCGFNHDNSEMPINPDIRMDIVMCDVSFALFNWAREHGFPWCPLITYEIAIRQRDIQLLAWLINSPWRLPKTGSATDPTAWLEENNLSYTYHPPNNEELQQVIDTMLPSSITRYISRDALRDFKRKAYIDVIRFLLRNDCPVALIIHSKKVIKLTSEPSQERVNRMLRRETQYPPPPIMYT